MSVQNLFGGFAGNTGGKIQGIGNDPTKVGGMGNPKSRLTARLVLPTEISAAAVLKEEKGLGQLTAEVELAKNMSATREQQVNKLVELQRINTDYSKKMMSADQSMRSLEEVHARGVAQHQLNAAVIQAAFDGYQEIYNTSATEIFG